MDWSSHFSDDPAPTSPMKLQVLKPGVPRLGKLTLPGRSPILTPHHVPATSRGVVPHLTPDNLAAHTQVSAVHVALEDFIEKWPRETPPILDIPIHPHPYFSNSRLRRFIALPPKPLCILSARRARPVAAAHANDGDALWVSTAVGFRKLKVVDYTYAVKRLRPDVVISLADIPEVWDKEVGEVRERWSSKRAERMVERVDKWGEVLLDGLEGRDETQETTKRKPLENTDGASETTPLAVWASIPPLDLGLQTSYLDRLEDCRDQLDGLTLHDARCLPSLPTSLAELLRYEIRSPDTPNGVLRHIGYGIDLCSIPFVGDATDAGIALCFGFNDADDALHSGRAGPRLCSKKSLGLDLWSLEHATSTDPIEVGCNCYACTTHYRAYLHHLLQAKEMLAWVLLQIHNLAVMDRFFAEIRKSIQNETFERDAESFSVQYESELPATVGKGPRVRGYQYKSEGPGEKPRNGKAYGRFSVKEEDAAEGLPKQKKQFNDSGIDVIAGADEAMGAIGLAGMDADEIEETGLAE